jgi:hypothetical protein
VTENSEAQAYLSEVNKKVRSLASGLHDVLLDLGCVSYVKTIYIGYDIAGEMVAALYAHIDYVEIALALPEDADGDLLIDASHLTWRTLPVAAIVRNTTDVQPFTELASAAVERVRTATHTVNRDNDFFAKSRRERRGN